MFVPADLVAAYRAAIYEVDVDGRPLTFHVDQANSGLDTLLAARGAQSGVFITAYNPRSHVRPEEDNAKAHGALIDAVREMDKAYLPARGRDAEDNGPTEAGLFVFDLSREDAVALARRFDQYATVLVEKGRPPSLVFS